MALRAKLEVGCRVCWEGEAWKLNGFLGHDVELRNPGSSGLGRKARVRLPTLVENENFRVLNAASEVLPQRQLPTFANTFPAGDRQGVEVLERHLQERGIACGVASNGSVAEGEPKEDFGQGLLRTTKAVTDQIKEMVLHRRFRNIWNRLDTSYRRFNPLRPGELVLIDSAPLDACAVDPVTLRWVPVQLSVVVDVFSRSLLAWDFTPASTKRVDAARLLYDLLRPLTASTDERSLPRPPYVGIPESVALELNEESIRRQSVRFRLGARDFLKTDGGGVDVSEMFKDLCSRLGVDVRLGGRCSPAAAGFAEQLFERVHEEFVKNLTGYIGSDSPSRLKDVENRGFYFIDELDALFAEWVADIWQLRPQAGLEVPETSGRQLGPSEMYEEGLKRAGFLHVLSDASTYFELLPIEWRPVEKQGIELGGLIYDDELLDQYRDLPCPYQAAHQGKYPIRFDARDLSKVFFFDPNAKKWLTIPRLGTAPERMRFDETTLGHAKSLVVARGGNVRDQDELNGVLDELLDRMRPATGDSAEVRKLAAMEAMQSFEDAKENARLSRGSCFWTRDASY
jgi:putative transposase